LTRPAALAAGAGLSPASGAKAAGGRSSTRDPLTRSRRAAPAERTRVG